MFPYVINVSHVTKIGFTLIQGQVKTALFVFWIWLFLLFILTQDCGILLLQQMNIHLLKHAVHSAVRRLFCQPIGCIEKINDHSCYFHIIIIIIIIFLLLIIINIIMRINKVVIWMQKSRGVYVCADFLTQCKKECKKQPISFQEVKNKHRLEKLNKTNKQNPLKNTKTEHEQQPVFKWVVGS